MYMSDDFPNQITLVLSIGSCEMVAGMADPEIMCLSGEFSVLFQQRMFAIPSTKLFVYDSYAISPRSGSQSAQADAPVALRLIITQLSDCGHITTTHVLSRAPLWVGIRKR